MIKAAVDRKYKLWAKYIPVIMMYINGALNRSLGMSPYRAMFGRNMRAPLDKLLQDAPPLEAVPDDLVRVICVIHELVAYTQQRAYESQKAAYDAVHKPIEFKPGQLVLVYRVPKLEHKLDMHWRGPLHRRRSVIGWKPVGQWRWAWSARREPCASAQAARGERCCPGLAPMSPRCGHPCA